MSKIRLHFKFSFSFVANKHHCLLTSLNYSAFQHSCQLLLKFSFVVFLQRRKVTLFANLSLLYSISAIRVNHFWLTCSSYLCLCDKLVSIVLYIVSLVKTYMIMWLFYNISKLYPNFSISALKSSSTTCFISVVKCSL